MAVSALPLSRCDLTRELLLANLTRALRACFKPEDHNARRLAYVQAGFTTVTLRDDLAAAALFRARTVAFAGAAA